MNHWQKGIPVGCLVVAVLAFTTQAPERLSRSATSTITSGIDQNGHEVITTTNRRFSFVEVYGSEDPLWMLLLEEFRSEMVPGIMGLPATVTVDGWVGDYPNPRKKAWTIRSEGDVGETDYNFYKVTRQGCCDSQTTQVWFSLLDGQKVFTSTISPIRVEVPNSNADLTRYVAWHSGEAVIPPEEGATMKDLRGTLQYCSERKELQRAILRGGDFYLNKSKVAFRYQGKLHDDKQGVTNGLGLWKVNGQTSKSALSDFSIVLIFNDQVEVEIPVENDELQIAKARVPPTLILEAAK